MYILDRTNTATKRDGRLQERSDSSCRRFHNIKCTYKRIKKSVTPIYRKTMKSEVVKVRPTR